MPLPSLLSILAWVAACGNSNSPIAPTAAPSTARADFQLSARVLGPVWSDDDADFVHHLG